MATLAAGELAAGEDPAGEDAAAGAGGETDGGAEDADGAGSSIAPDEAGAWESRDGVSLTCPRERPVPSRSNAPTTPTMAIPAPSAR